MPRQLILVLSLLLACAAGAATSHYVTDGGNGTQDGLSTNNAWSSSHFNLYYTSGGYCWKYWGNALNSGPQDPNPIWPGDTVHINGNFLTPLQVRGSGTNAGYYTNFNYYTNGSVIWTNADVEPIGTGVVTIVLDANQSWGSTNYNLAGVQGSALLFLNDPQDLVVDGISNGITHFYQTDSGWGKSVTNGVICINAGVDFVQRVTIKNVGFGPLTYRPSTNVSDTGNSNTDPGGLGVRMNGQLEHIQIVSNNFNYCVNGASLVYNGVSSNILVNYNFFTNFSEAVQIAANASSFPCQLTGLRLLWNIMDGQAPFNETSGDYHNNGIHVYGTPSGDYYSVTTSSNYFAAGSATMPAAILQGLTYNSGGVCVVSNFILLETAWWPSNNDRAMVSGLAALTNAYYLIAPTNFVAYNYQSFYTATNVYTLYGLPNAPVTCSLYTPAYGALIGMDVGWNIHRHGSDNNTSRLIFFGDEFPQFCIGTFVHDCLSPSDTNFNEFSSAQMDMNGFNTLVCHNTMVSVQDGQYGDAFIMIHGTGNRFYNNLVYQFNSIMSLSTPPDSQGNGYLQTVSDANWNDYAMNPTNATWRVGGSIPGEVWPFLFQNAAFGGYYTNPPMETASTIFKPAINTNNWALSVITTNNSGTNLWWEYAIRNEPYVGLDGLYRTNITATMGAFQGVNTNQPPPDGGGAAAFIYFGRITH